MVTAEEFLAQVDRFLERTGMTASAFGRAAVKDPNLVGDIRDGRSPSLRTLARVQNFMATHDTSPSERAA